MSDTGYEQWRTIDAAVREQLREPSSVNAIPFVVILLVKAWRVLGLRLLPKATLIAATIHAGSSRLCQPKATIFHEHHRDVLA